MLASALFLTLIGATAVITKTTTPAVPTPSYVFRGGIAGIQCKDPEQNCYDDLRDNCEPQNSGPDFGGICFGPKDIVTCGGIAGKRCSAGTRCYDLFRLRLRFQQGRCRLHRFLRLGRRKLDGLGAWASGMAQ
ncbi:hypothetical protein QBC47DRAFT_311557 [Echria macrotheca]|uniref:Uncharacterized protein n=1 Tax=Echria macrotheca TaxID=438768 RepID=A0AAJ0B0W6_9PEZI|nr:hypothetical protein QBC47DRAFT_311557 [Echria macrotheca]